MPTVLVRLLLVSGVVLCSTPALAQTGGAGGGMMQFILMMVMLFAVFYFLLIRPQQKRQKEHRAMIDAIRRGDTVVTSGGIIGRVTKVLEDDEIQLEIADNVRIRVIKSTLLNVRGKGEPAASDATSGKGKSEKPAANDEPANDKSSD